MSKMPKFEIMLPKMSWDAPIHEELLKYVRTMKRNWQTHRSIWPSVNRDSKIYASAYETIEKHIVREIEFRKEIGQL